MIAAEALPLSDLLPAWIWHLAILVFEPRYGQLQFQIIKKLVINTRITPAVFVIMSGTVMEWGVALPSVWQPLGCRFREKEIGYSIMKFYLSQPRKHS